jgi:murein DD-endopeptidase MepM/ murein hydrolase activator NlpD
MSAVLSRIAVVLLAGTLMAPAGPAAAEPVRLRWPLHPAPAVTRGFDAPSPNWTRGHRGVDLAGTPGQPVYAAAAATVVFAGNLAGRPLVSLQHPGGLRTTYEPVTPTVRPGDRVAAGTALGRLAAGHSGCPAAACLHWGAKWGPASRADYVDPRGLLADTPVRLKPLTPAGPANPGQG